MTDITELIQDLKEYADWAESNIYEVPITLPDCLRDAAELLDQVFLKGETRLEKLRLILNEKHR